MGDKSRLALIENLTVEEYKTAFSILREQMTDSDVLMLKANYESENHVITSTQLANKVGFPNFEAANLRYGLLASKLLEFFNIQLKRYAKLNVLVYFDYINDEWHWTLRPQVSQALHELNWFRTRQKVDYVQYHNSESMGKLQSGIDNKFGISTSKSFADLIGSKIWLISGMGKPRKYYLHFNFVADNIRQLPKGSDFKFSVTGQIGRKFQPAIPIGDFPWFKDFLKVQQNFSFGLRKIDKRYVDKFKNLISDRKAEDKEGGGLGNTEINKMIEEAAVLVVTTDYKKRGWKVTSVESEKRGYDLLCTKAGKKEHAEVKGIQGEKLSFIITTGEVKQSKTDISFIIYIVTSALSKPKLHRYTGAEFNNHFKLEPMNYRADEKP